MSTPISDLRQPSQRQLRVRVRLGALNIVQYQDRLTTTSQGTQAQGLTNINTNPNANALNINSPSRIQSYGNGFILPPNPDINAPYNTFLYGTLNNQSIFNLLAPPSDSTFTAFPFASTYGSLLKNPSSQLSFTGSDTSNTSNIDSAPYVPCNSSAQSITTPKLTTYNMWAIASSGSINTQVSYQRGNNISYPAFWNYGQATQTLDTNNQASILVDSTNNNFLSLRRMFNLRQDCLYDSNATIIYPPSSGIAPTLYNQRNGVSIINPRENCGFMITFNVLQFLGSSTQTNNLQGVTIKFGNIDLYTQASTSSNVIEYYELTLSNSSNPVLRFYDPVAQSFNNIIIQGPPLGIGINKIYVHFFGNILAVGFSENTYTWNAISPIQPTENENFNQLYHLIPGGRFDAQDDSGIQIDFNNVQTTFKYSGIAFKNIIAGINSQNTYNFFDSNNYADQYKISVSHQSSVSTTFLKQISQTTRLNDYFHAKACRLYERINNTPQYIKKINSIYGFSTEILSPTVLNNFANVSFARDWRLQDPYASDFNNSNPWEIKATITDPNYDPINSGDGSLSANMQLNIVFDSPVYSPVFVSLDTSNMPTNDISLSTSTSLSASQTNYLSALQDTNLNDLLIINSASYEASLVNPVFYFKWGNITDLIESSPINIQHTVNTTTGMGSSSTTLTINNLTFSTRGTNILNYIENNLTVIEISAGFSGDPLTNNVFFEGVITSVNTTVSPVDSKTTLQCSDWLNYVMNGTLVGTQIALQGITIRNAIDTGIKLAALQNFTSYLNSSQQNLPTTTSGLDATTPNGNADISLINALNFIIGNTTMSANDSLAKTINVTDNVTTILSHTLSFIVNDLSIPILYQNLRNELVQGSQVTNANGSAPRSAVVIENRYLLNSNATRTIDIFKFLVSPGSIQQGGSITNLEEGSLISNNITDFTYSSVDSQFHGIINSPLVRQSTPQNLYEGVYLFAQGLGNVPLYEVRSSDSYYSTNMSTNASDAWLYSTALNRAISDDSSGNANINVLDEIDRTDYNNETAIVTAWDPGNRFSLGYVGFRKRLYDQQNTAIQTAQDLQIRGDIYAQYIRKVVQNISFNALVTRPLQHYNNFYIQGLQSTTIPGPQSLYDTSYTQDPFQAVDNYFTRTEYSNFLYSSVSYTINKQNNTIIASVIGQTVPIIGPIVSAAVSSPISSE